MKEYDLGLIIEAINEVYDNIWLGDLRTAESVASTSLAEIQSEIDILKLQETANELKRDIFEIRKEARQKGIERRRLWVADKLTEELEKKEGFEPVKNIYGVLAIHLGHLKDAITYLVEAQAQKTMETFREREFERAPVFHRGERHRHTLQRLPDRWEVRAILDTPASAWNLRSLRNRVGDYDMAIEEVAKRGLSNIFEIYSKDMHVRVLGQQNLAEIIIWTPETKDVKERVSKMVLEIINAMQGRS